MMMKGAALLERTVTCIAAGTARKLPQTGAPGTLKHAPKLTPENCRIRWTNSAHAVHDHVRGLSPYPGAWTLMRTAKGTSHFKVLAARVHGSLPNKEPGTVVTDGNRLVVHCGEGALELLEVQPEGRKRMGAGEFVRGAQNAGTISFE
jgi:methionyl-tRNA formyltransferase